MHGVQGVAISHVARSSAELKTSLKKGLGAGEEPQIQVGRTHDPHHLGLEFGILGQSCIDIFCCLVEYVSGRHGAGAALLTAQRTRHPVRIVMDMSGVPST